jgi:hypothetical protein
MTRNLTPYPPYKDSGVPWLDESSTRVGYEISFTRYFYKPQPLRTLAEITADIEKVEHETYGLLESILHPDKES